MALASQQPPALLALPPAAEAETKRVALPGGGMLWVPLAFVADRNAKARTPTYLWRDETGPGSIEVELIAYHRAVRLDRAAFRKFIEETLAPKGGTIIGTLDAFTVDGCVTWYARYRLGADADAAPDAPRAGVHARILTSNAGILFEATHGDIERADDLAKAVLASLTLSNRGKISRW